MSDAVVEGGCLCGDVRYRVADQPKSSSVCHCPTCRRASGAPGVAWYVVRLERFELLCGELRSFASSSAVLRQFCGRCGTQIAYRHRDNPELIELTTASLDDPEVFPPTKEIWLSHKLSWEAINPARCLEAEES